MSEGTDWHTVRHQVAVAGRVVDVQGHAVAGTEVILTLLPKLTRRGTGGMKTDGRNLNKPLDRTFTKADGVFFFLDLPAGEYTVECVNPRAGLRAKKTASVSWRQDGTVERAVADLKLSKA